MMVERDRAFEQFYATTRGEVLRAVAFALEDMDLAQEVTDEALARAYERWSEVARLGNSRGWVYRVAINLGKNRHRRLLLERRKPPPVGRGLPDIDGVADPAIAAALAELPLDQRSAVVLRYHLDWPMDEIAAALDIPVGTVKSRLHRALRRLETLLEEPV